MQLYYAPGTCSLASHIALQESGLHYSTVRVNLRDRTTADGADYTAVNPKGYVPALKLDDGEVLTEGPAVLAYIGALVPAKQLIPAPGSLANFRVHEWLIFISTELHKNMSPLFRPTTPEATREFQLAQVKRRLATTNDALAGKSYLTGEHFTVADAYLFTVLNWHQRLKFDLAEWPNLAAFHQRVKARPAVQQAMKDEDQGA